MGCVVTSVAGKPHQGDEFIHDLINIHPEKEEERGEFTEIFSVMASNTVVMVGHNTPST